MNRFLGLISLFVLSLSVTPVSAINMPSPSSPAIRVTPPAPKFTDAERHAELARRRAAVAAKLPDKSMLILFSAEPKLYTNDVDYVYRQENNLYYLTALKQPNATYVLIKDGGAVREMLFLPKRNAMREAWEGKMYSSDDAARISGLKTIVDASEQPTFLSSVSAKSVFSSTSAAGVKAPVPETVYLLLPNSDEDHEGRREFRVEAVYAERLADHSIQNARPIFAELRHIKSPYELKLMQHAIDITTEAQMRAMAMVGRAKWEYEVQAEIEYTFRRRNADFWGYPSIVGCGPNATTLHYVESQSPVKHGELVLMDVGAEYDHYTADVTRTFPVSGKFTKEQAEIYQIVYDAQEAAARATKPGATFGEISNAARNTIADGLLKRGLITEENQVGMWFIHGLGHWLGMNVHDVGDYNAPLKAGMIYTNEPGIYIREDALDRLPDTPAAKAFIAKIKPAFEKYKNIGVRIEDDMLVTGTGVEWMTKNLPRKLADVESFMARASKEMPYTASLMQPTFVQQIGAVRYDSPLFALASQPSGVTMRRGIVWSGKRTAYSADGHADHSHAE